MLTPEALQSVNDYLTALCDEWQNSVIADIARRLCKSWKLTASAQHQSIQLLRTVKDKESLIKDIAKMTGALETAVQEVFAYTAEESWIFAQNLANAAGVNTVNLAMNELVMQQYVGLLNQTQLEMTNFTRTTGFISSDGQFREIDRAYQYELDLATWKISSGTMDATQAIRDAIRSLSKRGITSIDYANGKVSSLDVAVRRSVLTGIGQLTGEISLQTAEKLDTDFVEVSAHYGARPEHAEWQGKVYKLNGSAPGYPNLAEATGYGTGPGLKGWNCRHDFYPFIPGISRRAYTDRELAEMKPEAKQFTFEGKAYDGYTATQMQRRIESAIRKTKRELAGYDAANDAEAFTTQSVKLRQQKELYADFSKAADLPLQNERIQVLGFDKSVSSKAVWAEKKEVANYYKGYLGTTTYRKTVNKLKEIGYNNKWLLDGFVKAVDNGSISVLVGIEQYIATAREIERELIGITTKDGIVIKGYVTHFIDRVIGTHTGINYPIISEQLKKRLNRKGIEISKIKEALVSAPDIVYTIRKDGNRSQKYCFSSVEVSLNPDTKKLIQVNPARG